MYKYILFDLDGTLTDSAPGIINCIKYACAKMELPCPDEATLFSFVGPPLKGMFAKTFSLSESDAEKAVALYRERFSTVGLFENSVYPGVPELLKKLKGDGLHLALATSKPQVYAEKITDKFALSPYFDFISGSELSGAHVEKIDVMRSAMASLNASEESTVMVGDRMFDINASRALNVTSIAVTYGYAPEGELLSCHPDFFAASPEEVYSVIRNLQYRYM